MGTLKHYYKILGVAPGASLQEINQAYINLLNELHPCRSSDDPRQRQKAQATAKAINEAYREIKKAHSLHRDLPASPAQGEPSRAPLPSLLAGTAAGKAAASRLASARLVRGLLLAALSVTVIVILTKALIPAPAARQGIAPVPPAAATPHRRSTAPTMPAAAPTARHSTSSPPATAPAKAPAAGQSIAPAPAVNQAGLPEAAAGQGKDRAALHAMAVREAAERGDSVAQGRLGYLYLVGKGVPQDYGEAAAWYRKAAEQGHAGAQNWLGYLYETGKGVRQDFSAAAAWYRRAAEQDDAEAQKNLALLYANGKGVARNLKEAREWCRKAAGQGNAEAQRTLELLTEE